jgi:signal transduction histidine kinase
MDRLSRSAGGGEDHARRSAPSQTDSELPDALSVAAHDVAEAVRVVSGYAELLTGHLGSNLDEAARRYLDGVRDGVDHLDALLRGLLGYVRVNVEPPAIEDVELAEALDEALRPLRAELERRDARVEIGDLPGVRTDPGRVRDALRALLDNALAFASDAPPAIAVTAHRQADGWRIDVRDNGIGLPDDARERVLEPFERAHARSIATGPGLGLAIARRIVERGGGRLWLDAADGGGTVAHFTVPDRPPAP